MVLLASVIVVSEGFSIIGFYFLIIAGKNRRIFGPFIS